VNGQSQGGGQLIPFPSRLYPVGETTASDAIVTADERLIPGRLIFGRPWWWYWDAFRERTAPKTMRDYISRLEDRLEAEATRDGGRPEPGRGSRARLGAVPPDGGASTRT
jgi:hypothetical protein